MKRLLVGKKSIDREESVVYTCLELQRGQVNISKNDEKKVLKK